VAYWQRQNSICLFKNRLTFWSSHSMAPSTRLSTPSRRPGFGTHQSFDPVALGDRRAQEGKSAPASLGPVALEDRRARDRQPRAEARRGRVPDDCPGWPWETHCPLLRCLRYRPRSAQPQYPRNRPHLASLRSAQAGSCSTRPCPTPLHHPAV